MDPADVTNTGKTLRQTVHVQMDGLQRETDSIVDTPRISLLQAKRCVEPNIYGWVDRIDRADDTKSGKTPCRAVPYVVYYYNNKHAHKAIS